MRGRTKRDARGLAVALACLAAAPAAAAEAISVWSDISRSRCTVNDRRPAAARDAHDPVIYHCRTLPGRSVTLRFGGTAVAITFVTEGAAAPEPQLSTGNDVGPRIEWRGAGRGRAFAPQAAILRLVERDGTGKPGSALAVMKVQGARLCAVAFVEGSRPAANEEARVLADAAGAFRCDIDPPKLVGDASPAARAIRERNR